MYCSIGGTVVQATLTATTVQRGVFGSNRSAERPIVINMTGEENLKGSEFYQPYTISKFLRNQILKMMGEEFRELKPEKETFITLTMNLRLILDDGNHIGALLLGGLTVLYLYANNSNIGVKIVR